ncbi:MAG TPA: SRPBCC domain-containing protein [Calditrichia bacterium]|nr:SRPBCC domain-containing protein [Calditrichota bacterium]HQU71380.1 SRPBCC domain-containing protein [Calditrichia bacterium]HQV30868.1 SRPBCC domain-containing protein [Calditrichia bacterium]
MKKMTFEIDIAVSPARVHELMLGEGTYGQWTAPFDPSSRFEGSWEKGSRILFIGNDDKGNTSGMVSRIFDNIPGKFVAIEHLGLVQNGEEILSGEKVDGFKGAREDYHFTATESGTHLKVEMDMSEGWAEFMSTTWPKALKKLKDICEA